MKVSIIVPIYNVEKYIERCVKSLFAQTYKNIEYIFVDDCSTDSSLLVLNNILKNYKSFNIKIIRHEINRGLPSSRNSGLKVATGDFIYNCDSDDWIDNDMIRAMVAKLIEENADIVYCDIYNFYQDKTEVYRQLPAVKYEDHVKNFLIGYSQGSVCNKLFNRKLFTNNNICFPDGYSMLEDLRTTIKLFYYAQNIVYLEQPFYYYDRTRDDSITGKNSNMMQSVRMDFLTNVNSIVNFLKEKEIKISEKIISRFKLGAKKNLLVKGRSIAAFKSWKNTFPETNGAIWGTDYPLVYKMLAYAIEKDWWFIAKIWIRIKYDILRK